MDRPTDLSRRAVETLYVHAMLLADDAKSTFDHPCALPDDADMGMRSLATVERLRLTTRVMHVVAWLLTRRAVTAGEIDEAAARDPSRALGDMPASDPEAIRLLPDDLRLTIHASIDLAARATALARAIEAGPPEGAGPAHDLQDMLRRRYAA